jgi:hypothetical protein
MMETLSCLPTAGSGPSANYACFYQVYHLSYRGVPLNYTDLLCVKTIAILLGHHVNPSSAGYCRIITFESIFVHVFDLVILARDETKLLSCDL